MCSSSRISWLRLRCRRCGDARLALASACLGGLLDYIENHHILAQRRTLQVGGALSLAAIQVQMLASSLKWLVGHAAFVALGIALRPADSIDKVFRFALIGVQLPVGVLVWTDPSPFWYWGRALNLLFGFVFVAIRAQAWTRSAAAVSGAEALA